MVYSGQLSLLPSVGQEMSSSYGYGGEGLVWRIEAMVCLLAASWVQLSVSTAMDGYIMRCGTVGLC